MSEALVQEQSDFSEAPLAVNIVKINEDHEYVLDEALIDKIFLNKRIKDLKIVILSVAGAFRKGKSFILNFFIQYASFLELESSEEQIDNWLNDSSQLVNGFKWRGGSERETTGIWVWNKAFIINHPVHEKIALFFMDTQGSFDSQSTVKDCATIFALSTMLSSVQIYNVSSNIQEDDLQHLQLFTEYGRLALETCDHKPFQKLQFLVRDWSYPYEYAYGEGSDFLAKKLSSNISQHQELQSVRKHVLTCFENVSCYLLPHPGMNVATNPNFKGSLKEIDDVFKNYVKEFVPHLLDHDKIKLKCINGVEVLCRDIPLYLKSYIKIFGKDVLPEPKSMLMATAEANNLSALASSKEYYSSEMEKFCGASVPYLSQEVLVEKNNEIFSRALEHFHSSKKMGGISFSETFVETLKTELELSYKNFVKINQSKDLMRVLRVPIVCCAFAIITYILATILDLVGLDNLAFIISSLTFSTIVMAITWIYLRISGGRPDILHIFDVIGDNLWDLLIIKLITAITANIVQSNFSNKNPPNSNDANKKDLKKTDKLYLIK